MGFEKATKTKAKLRCAVFGPSGAGKTFSCLRIASGMSKRIALIDTERGSASKYADRFEFDVCVLAGRTIDDYIAAINEAASAGYEVLIIDSLSHGWQELLAMVDRLAKSKYQGNSWAAWNEGTPKQKEFIDALLGFPGHVLATMRSKTEWTCESGRNGRTQPVRVGLAPEQGKGIEFEFDLLIELSTSHTATILKDRTSKFQDEVIDKPGEDFGKKLLAWLADGAEPATANTTPIASATAALAAYASINVGIEECEQMMGGKLAPTWTEADVNTLRGAYKKRKDEYDQDQRATAGASA